MPMCYENVSVRLTIIISAIERPLLAIGPHRSFVASVRSSLHLYALPATLNRAFVHAVVGCLPTYYASFADQRSPFENFRSRCHLNELIRWIRSVALLVLTKYRKFLISKSISYMNPEKFETFIVQVYFCHKRDLLHAVFFSTSASDVIERS